MTRTGRAAWHPARRRSAHEGRTGSCGTLGRRPTLSRSPTLSAKQPGRSTTPAPQPTRRERRAAARRAEAARTSSSSSAWRSPTVLITIAAVVIALAVIAILNNRPGEASGTGSTATPAPAGSAANVAVTAPGSPLPDGVTRDGRTLGPATAKVTLDVWEDFQCPACGSFSNQIEPVLISRYVVPGQLKITYHDFAFIGQESQDAASAARCAGQQGKFWEFHDYLFANQNGENQGWFTRDRFVAIAGKIGLDQAAFQACYDGGAQRQAVTAETQSGSTVGVASTPTLILDGRTLSLSSYTSWDDFLGDIDRTIIAAGGSIAPSSPTPAASPSS